MLAATWWIRGESESEERRRWILLLRRGDAGNCGLVALRDTKADRYVFPAYFFAAAGGTVLAIITMAAH